MQKKALIVFIKNPVAGKVKTRLAATVGPEKALDIYHQLLACTLQVTKDLAVDKYIFYTDFVPGMDEWKSNDYYQQLQSGSDLGERMQQAFGFVFSKGYNQVVIIGSDCIELTAAIIEMAFEGLPYNDVVIGPANDGGYYLLGMKQLHSFLFTNKAWSTAHLLNQTVSECRAEKLSVLTLPVLIDIDDETDLTLYNTRKVQ